MNSASTTKLSKVHPLLAERIRLLAQNLAARGINIEVVQGLRTFAEQEKLFAQGRTKSGPRVTNAKGGQSNHNYGVAVDVAPTKNGKIDWEDLPAFVVIGGEAKKLGLKWGGDWKKFVDKPHLELPSPDIKTLRKLFDKGGLKEVWRVVNSTEDRGALGLYGADLGNDADESEAFADGRAAPPEANATEARLEAANDAVVSTPAPRKPDNPAPQDVSMQATAAVDGSSRKSMRTMIGAAITAFFAWVAANVGEAFGWIKNLDINQFLKWLMILVAAVAIVYLIRQMVRMVLTLVGNIVYNVVSMWSHANPATNNVKLVSPAPSDEEAKS